MQTISCFVGKHWFLFSVLAMSAMLVACSDSSDTEYEQPLQPSQNTVEIYKLTGSAQCEPGSGVSLGYMLAELNNQDIAVYTAACGVMTGMQFITMCGASDGSINVFTIDEADFATAMELGFATTDQLPAEDGQPAWQLMKCAEASDGIFQNLQ